MRRIAAVLTVIALGAMFFTAGALIRRFGEPPSTMDEYMIENSQRETGSNNVVSAVVFDYRGYDTLGEATILFTAVTAVVMLLRRRKDEVDD